MRWRALPPRYGLSEFGLNGSSKAFCGSHGFCQGAVPFASISIMESVTSCRKSLLTTGASSVIGFALPFKVGFGKLVLEARAIQSLAAQGVNYLLIDLGCQSCEELAYRKLWLGRYSVLFVHSLSMWCYYRAVNTATA